MRKCILYIVLIASVSSCEELENLTSIDLPDDASDMIGRWQVVEYGYSPGAGYFVESVPLIPAQVLTFSADGKFNSNYHGFEDHNFFNIIEQNDELILVLSDDQPVVVTETVDIDYTTYNIWQSIEEGKTELWYRYCREGCHVGIRKIE
ncbi:MAG: hypothetical protein JXR07_15785 [Reichenbachiella sp.]